MVRLARSMSLFVASAVCLLGCAYPGFAQTGARPGQSNGAANGTAAAAPAVALQPFTAQDQSASAGIPAGWQVTTAAQTDIVISGPNGETVFLGRTIVTRNGPFQLGQRLGGGLDFNMPYSANLAQKFLMILQQNAAAQGHGQQAPANIISATPVQVPQALGQCGRFIGDLTSDKGPMKFEAFMCSLPFDTAGVYKNMFKMGTVPAQLAAQERATVEAMFASYRVPMNWLRRKLAPFTPLPPAGAGGGAGSPGLDSSTIWRMRTLNDSMDCMDLVVVRELPKNQLPKKCGGTKDDDE